MPERPIQRLNDQATTLSAIIRHNLARRRHNRGMSHPQ